jgi:hypothetical protein
VDHYRFLHTIYRSPPLPLPLPPPQSMLLQPKHIKPDEKWDTTLNRGRGGLTFVEIQRFCGICPKTFETDCLKGIFNLFELPGVLEYQFRENHIAFSITCLLNYIGICNVLTVLRWWSISLKCNTIQQYIINELIYTKICECGVWKYAERLNLVYMQGRKHVYLVNYRPRLLQSKMQG